MPVLKIILRPFVPPTSDEEIIKFINLRMWVAFIIFFCPTLTVFFTLLAASASVKLSIVREDVKSGINAKNNTIFFILFAIRLDNEKTSMPLNLRNY